jgi:para-nitrobenzyl esterase
MAHLISPRAAGLFQRAIIESGTHIEPYPADTALKAGQAFAAAAGCAGQDAACLRALSVAQVLHSQAGVVRHIVEGFPTVDGTVLTREAAEAFDQGAFNQVPILAGLTQDEQAFFLPEANHGAPFTTDDYRRHLASFGAAHIAALARRYPLERYASPSLADIELAQGFKACTSRRLYRAWSRRVPVYVYQFNDRGAPTYFPALSYPMRAYHTAELQYLFPLFRGGQGSAHPLDAARAKLSDAMVDYWTSFARRGTPSAAGEPDWPRYDGASDDVQYLDSAGIRTATGYGAQYDCTTLWDPVLAR